MDTSKEYILMCEKAVEVQELQTVYPNYEHSFFGTNESGGKPIWLPRQDQLQGMVGKTTTIAGYVEYDANKNNIPQLLSVFQGFVYELCMKNISNCNWSMEQLWLAFVQKELHNKTWDGGDWK